MTPTEQDKELFENSFGEWLENHGVEIISNNQSHLGTWQAMVDMNELKLAIMQLITADRKRVELEARLQEVEVSIIELERSDDPRFYSKDEAIRSQRARYTQLKAQQEEFGDS